jgi:outer membrane immunogenic protein
MRNLSVAAIAGLCAVAFMHDASAADIPTKAPAQVESTAYSWTGWFAGANFGYGWGGSTGDNRTGVDPANIFGGGGLPLFIADGGLQYPSIAPHGTIGGFQVGYNWQTPTRLVVGVVADFQFSGITASGQAIVPPLNPGAFFAENQSHSATINWFGTLRGRVGYAWDRWQPYLSGGLAYGRVSDTINVFIPTSGYIGLGNNSSTRTGWTAGGGIDYAYSERVTFGIEYLYIDLGNQTVSTASQNFLPAASAVSFLINDHFTANIVRGTINFKF